MQAPTVDYTITVAEVFIFLLLTSGYVPVLRAYLREPQSQWLLAAYSALLIGQFLSIIETYLQWLNFLEHGLGIALAGILLAVHARKRYEETTSMDRNKVTAVEGPVMEDRR